MDERQLRSLFEQVREGAVDVDSALRRLRHMPFEDLGFAKVDHHRALRHGMPEVIFAKGKTPEQVARLRSDCWRTRRTCSSRARTRTPPRWSLSKLPAASIFRYRGAIRFWRDKTVRGKGKIMVVCAGTSDIPVAEEAQVTAEVMGNEVDAIHDVGVAGIHRLMSNQRAADGSARDRGLRGHGRRAAERRGRHGFVPGDRGAHKHRLWRELSRAGGAARHAEQLRQQRDGGQYRQRLRRRIRRQFDQPVIGTGGLRLCQSVRLWNSFPNASSMFSEKGKPTTCRPNGSLPAKPQGSASAGMPARFPAAINAPMPGCCDTGWSKCRSNGSLIPGAGPGRVGASSTSRSLKSLAISLVATRRTRMAFKYTLAGISRPAFNPAICF